MPATDTLSRRSVRPEKVESMESTNDGMDIEAFQRQVADRFHGLSAADPGDLLSLSWMSKVLDVFLSCLDDFRTIMLVNKGALSKAPMDRNVLDLFDRSLKALDVCNAIRDGIEQIRQWQKHIEIVLCALGNEKSLGEGQFRRAKKALVDLAIGMLDEKDSNASIANRNRSFGRQKDQKSLSNFRSLSWSVSRSWSAARQLMVLGNNLSAPKSNEIAATNGLALTVYTMSSVLLFAMWALVAAIPCQDRGLQAHFNIPRQFIWAVPIVSLHERIMEESKKKERRNSCGLLKEIHQIEICARYMNEITDMVQFPLTEEKEKEVRGRVLELSEVFEVLKNGLDPLERQVREVFHRIVRGRSEYLDSTKGSHPE